VNYRITGVPSDDHTPKIIIIYTLTLLLSTKTPKTKNPVEKRLFFIVPQALW
jgi:hypothetical protein